MNTFATLGVLKVLHSGQGIDIDGVVLRGLCDLIETTKTRTTPYHSHGDGQIEKMN